MELPFVGGAYTSLSVNENCQTCINLYPERDNNGGKYPSILYGTPGLTLYLEKSGNSVRGLYEINNTLYAVIDNKFYSILDNKISPIAKGTLKTGVGPVSIWSNDSKQVWVVDGLAGYIFDPLKDTFELITAEDFIPPTVSTYQDGFGIFIQPNTNIWWLTDINDFSKIDPLDFFSLSGAPGNLVSLISSHQELWLFNRQTAEIWYNTGGENFFERRQGLLIEYGSAAQYSVTKSSNGVISWLTRNTKGSYQFVRAEGFIPKIISTPAIERIISKYEKVSDCIAYTYQIIGHEFSVWTFPSADATWVYDHVENEWHQRTSTIENPFPRVQEVRQGRHRSNCYAFAFGKHLVGDAFSGNIYELDPYNYTENGMYIARERAAPHDSEDLNLFSVTNLELSAETGVGLASGQGSDPKIMFDISKNNGHTFGTELWRSLGEMGEFKKRVRWTRLGKGRDWVPRFRITDPVKVAWMALRADLTVGMAHKYSREKLKQRAVIK